MVYETNSNNFVIENTSDGYIENIKLDGKTLVNLWGNKTSDFFLSGQATFNEETDYVELTSTSHRFSNVFTKYTDNLKPNTLYTIIVDVVENTFAKSDIPTLRVSSPDPTQGHSCFNETRYVNGGRTGKFVFTTTTIRDFSNANIGLRTFVDNINSEIGCKLKFRIIILEGDHTQNPPSYFEGLKSVGQSATTSEEGVDEIVVSSVNENLFDGKIQTAYINNNTFASANSSKSIVFRCEQNTDYIFSAKEEFDRSVVGGSNSEIAIGTPLSQINATKKGNSIYFNSGQFNYIAIYFNTIDSIFTEVRVIKGTTLKPYTPHQSNKKRLLYYNNETQIWEKPILRQWDSIEKHSNGKYYYHQRSAEVVLNGSENWTIQPIPNVVNTLRFGVPTTPRCKGAGLAICDKYTYAYNDSDTEHIKLGTKDGNLFVYIDIAKLSTQDIQGFKQWLQANNVTVVYQLAQEEVYECLPIPVASYKGETTYKVDGGVITPASSFELDYSLSNAVGRISDVKAFNNAMKNNLKTHINKIREVL